MGVLGAVLLVTVIVELSQPQAEQSVPPPPRSAGRDSVPSAAPRTVRPSKAIAAEARGVVARFVLTAVLREHVGRSWSLVTPTLRSGLTRAEWGRGAIPVVPYPRSSLGVVRWKPLYTYRDELGYELLFMPKPHVAQRPVAFDVGVRRVNAHWLVSSWVAASPGAPLPAAPGDRYVSPHPVGRLWLLIPAGLFGLILLLPVFVLGRDSYRHARAVRRAA